jgi:hypothetical protein
MMVTCDDAEAEAGRARERPDDDGVADGTEQPSGLEKLAYSVPEVAAMLGISRASAYTYVRTGVIRSVSLGGRIIVPRRVIDDLMDLDEAG